MDHCVDYYILKSASVSCNFELPTHALKQRAKALQKPKKHHAYKQSIIKNILSLYSTDTPKFTYNAWGKPCLENCGVQINWSDSGMYLLVVVSKSMQIGCDVQKMHLSPNMHVIWDRFLRVPQASNNFMHAFFYQWTRWEAWSKCKGTGLLFSKPLPTITNHCFSNSNGSFFYWSNKKIKNYMFSLCALGKSVPVWRYCVLKIR